MKPVHFDLVQLREHYSHKLLHRFHNELMVTNFPIPEELDDVEVWEYALSPELENERDGRDPMMQIVLALDTPAQTTSADIPYCDRRILGGVVYEYYHQSACALVSYIVTDASVRRSGVLRRAHTACIDDLHQIAAKGRGLRAVFMETNAPGFDDGVMNNDHRHEVLYRLGYRQVECLYNQPPLGTGESPCEDLCLLVYKPDIPITRLRPQDAGKTDPDDRPVSGRTALHQSFSQASQPNTATRVSGGTESHTTESSSYIPSAWLYEFVDEFARSTLGHANNHLWLKERYFRDFAHSLRMNSSEDSGRLRIQPTLPLQTRLGCPRYHIAVICDSQISVEVAASVSERLNGNVGCTVTLVGPQTSDELPGDGLQTNGGSVCADSDCAANIQNGTDAMARLNLATNDICIDAKDGGEKGEARRYTPKNRGMEQGHISEEIRRSDVDIIDASTRVQNSKSEDKSSNLAQLPNNDCCKQPRTLYYGEASNRTQGAYQIPIAPNTKVWADCVVVVRTPEESGECETRREGHTYATADACLVRAGLESVANEHRTEVNLPHDLKSGQQDIQRVSEDLFRTVIVFLLQLSSRPMAV